MYGSPRGREQENETLLSRSRSLTAGNAGSAVGMVTKASTKLSIASEVIVPLWTWIKARICSNWLVFMNFLGTVFLVAAFIINYMLLTIAIVTVCWFRRSGTIEVQLHTHLNNLAEEVKNLDNVLAIQTKKMEDQQLVMHKQLAALKAQGASNELLVTELESDNAQLKRDLDELGTVRQEIESVLGHETNSFSEALQIVKNTFESTKSLLQENIEAQARVQDILRKNEEIYLKLQRACLQQISHSIEFKDAGEGFSKPEFRRLEFRLPNFIRPTWDRLVVSWEHQISQHCVEGEEETLSFTVIKSLMDDAFMEWKRSATKKVDPSTQSGLSNLQ